MAKSNDTPRALVKPSLYRLIDRSIEIETESAQESGNLGFIARAMVLATLPHRKTEELYFERKNGRFTLSMVASPKIGLPYGSVPRLLLAWATTEAVRTKSRELELGDSITAFMTELGMSRQGSNIASLKNQTRRLFNATVSASYENGRHIEDIGYRLADKTVLWWASEEPEQAGSWKSKISLSEIFFNEVVQRPVPIDMRAIRAIRQSPMALDIYIMLTHRMSYLKQSTVISWASLAFQLGADYKLLRQFKAAFLAELPKVLLVYSAVQAEVTDYGLKIKPSPTHIPMTRRKP